MSGEQQRPENPEELNDIPAREPSRDEADAVRGGKMKEESEKSSFSPDATTQRENQRK